MALKLEWVDNDLEMAGADDYPGGTSQWSCSLDEIKCFHFARAPVFALGFFSLQATLIPKTLQRGPGLGQWAGATVSTSLVLWLPSSWAESSSQIFPLSRSQRGIVGPSTLAAVTPCVVIGILSIDSVPLEDPKETRVNPKVYSLSFKNAFLKTKKLSPERVIYMIGNHLNPCAKLIILLVLNTWVGDY